MTECSCVCDSLADGDDPDIYRDTYPRARKAHKCCECQGTIRPGEKYERVEACWDGTFETYKTCMPCANIRKGLFKFFEYGRLREHIQNCLGFDYLADVKEL